MKEMLEVKFVSPKKGNGVFTTKNIRRGSIFDIAHFILISNDEYDIIKDTTIGNYLFSWDENKSQYQTAIPFTICQFINHSFNPNAKYSYKFTDNTIEFSAIKDILKDEEITLNYNGVVEDKTPVWFEVEQ